MKKILVIVDMQNDFLDGNLANPAAKAIVPGIVKLIKEGNWDNIVTTFDTHYNNYFETSEGKYLPIRHCLFGTEGHDLDSDIKEALVAYGEEKVESIFKCTFGYDNWNEVLLDLDPEREGLELTFVGTCTEICVVSNALAVKTALGISDNNIVRCVESLCAGLSPEKHAAAIEVMKSCQVEIIK